MDLELKQSENRGDMAAQKRSDPRFSMPAPGEYYRDLLEVDSWVNGRTVGVQANSLLCSKLQEREARVRERVRYLAQKRGISVDKLWVQILQGNAGPIESADIALPEDEGLLGQ